MNTSIYIDKSSPLFACREEKLSDGSKVWNIHVRGDHFYGAIKCVDEKRADSAMAMLAAALKIATGEEPLVL